MRHNDTNIKKNDVAVRRVSNLSDAQSASITPGS
jgi:hypothetical protein